MTPSHAQPDFELVTFAWRLLVTLLFVLANGFFVAAEFAFVKVRATRLRSLAAAGSRRARVAKHLHEHLDHYLSACQLGITLSSLILGWLAEPAVAELLLAGVAALDWQLSPDDPIVHGVALAIALSVVTILHMTIGEQAPKMWAIHRSESTALQVADALRVFAAVLRPFIALINALSNWLLRLVGISAGAHDAPPGVEELKHILLGSAESGHISDRQRVLAENVLSIVGLEVRHILVPRVDVVFLSLRSGEEENLRLLRESGHSRLPLCRDGLDTVVGIVHVKDVLAALGEGRPVVLEEIARPAISVSDTQPLSLLISRMQRARHHCALVLDEHGTAVGLAFLEDALEEIVGPIADEFDERVPELREIGVGRWELPGSTPLPEVRELLGLPDLGDESDTIGGYVVAQLGRLPTSGDALEIGRFRVTVTEASRNRVRSLQFEPGSAEAAATDAAGSEG